MSAELARKGHEKRLAEAIKRAIGVARTGIPLRAAISDTAMQSGIDAMEIAEGIDLLLTRHLAAAKERSKTA